MQNHIHLDLTFLTIQTGGNADGKNREALGKDDGEGVREMAMGLPGFMASIDEEGRTGRSHSKIERVTEPEKKEKHVTLKKEK